MYRWSGIFLCLVLFAAESTFHRALATEDAAALQSLIDNRQYGAALERVNTALETRPEDGVLLLSKGYLLVALGRLGDAAIHYRDVIDRLPDRPEPGNNLAIVYRNQGRHSEALKQLDSVLRAHPLFEQAYANLLQICRRVTRRRGEFGMWFRRDRGEIESATAFCDNYDHLGLMKAMRAALTGGNGTEKPTDNGIRITTLSPADLPSAPLDADGSDPGFSSAEADGGVACAAGKEAEARAVAAEMKVASLEARLAELAESVGKCSD